MLLTIRFISIDLEKTFKLGLNQSLLLFNVFLDNLAIALDTTQLIIEIIHELFEDEWINVLAQLEKDKPVAVSENVTLVWILAILTFSHPLT